jgi:large subunit ribosomal protein L4
MSPARKASTPDEPEDLANETSGPAADDVTAEADVTGEAAGTEATGAGAKAAEPEAAEAEAAEAEAEAKPAKPARRRPAAKDKAPAEDDAAEPAQADAAQAEAAADATDATVEDAQIADAGAEDAVEDEETEADEAPAKAPARRTTRKQPAPKPKRAAAVASHSLVDADLPADIFDVQVNVPLIHQVVVAQQAAARQGTHSTKTRGDVRGGGKKPYRQKGTGRARQGSTRAPQFAGGGTVHGPVPRSYAQKTPKKMKAAALRGALSDRARHGLIQVVDGFIDGAEPKTRDAMAVLNLATGGSIRHNVLVVAEATDHVTWKSLRNAVGVHLIDPGQLNTYDVLVSDRVVFTSAALASFVARAGSTATREDA